MYAIALTFWISFAGFCVTVAVLGGLADALLTSSSRARRARATAPRPVGARAGSMLDTERLAEAA